MQLNLKLNTGLQSLLIILQSVNWMALPQRVQLVAGVVVSVAQGLVALLGHRVNPDGSPATVAYRPKGSE